MLENVRKSSKLRVTAILTKIGRRTFLGKIVDFEEDGEYDEEKS